MNAVVCFGEVLFDVFPDKKIIGGAPLNVALRLHALGIETFMVSRVGKDANGEAVQHHILDLGMSTTFIGTDKVHATGTVEVTLNSKGNASYKIVENVAWDYIEGSDSIEIAVKNSAALIFGSLVCRNNCSQKSLLKLITLAPYTVFDLNLRPPFYSITTLIKLLKQVDFIKCNDEELMVLAEHYGVSSLSIKEQIKAIIKKTGAASCCVTLGSEGALLYHEHIFFKQKGFSVIVKDTVGSGDSFLATLIAGLLSDISPKKALERAAAMGALVAESEGGNPTITESLLTDFISRQNNI